MKNKILVVDDEPNICLLIKEILEDEGFQVEIVNNGEKARDAFNKNIYELVLLDVWMPDVDGISLLREFINQKKETNFIMMSGHGTVDTAIQATKFGAKAFLEKPISLNHLVETIRYYTSEKKDAGKNISNPYENKIPISLQGNSSSAIRFQEKIKSLINDAHHCFISGSFFYEWDSFDQYLTHQLQKSGKNTILADPFGSELKGNDIILIHLESYDIKYNLKKIKNFFDRSLHSGSKVIVYSKSLSIDQFQINFSKQNFNFIEIPKLSEVREDILKIFINLFKSQFNIEPHLTKEQIALLESYSWPFEYLELNSVIKNFNSTNELVLGLSESQLLSDELSLTNDILGLNYKKAKEVFEYVYFKHHLKSSNEIISRLAGRIDVERTYLYRKLKKLNIQ
ncbi:MAG: sigma-54-dependent transcriptional regulator [Gammaproteobacteria bacterium]|jgi:two-component system nitrogen regulation response regulator NtrX